MLAAGVVLKKLSVVCAGNYHEEVWAVRRGGSYTLDGGLAVRGDLRGGAQGNTATHTPITSSSLCNSTP